MIVTVTLNPSLDLTYDLRDAAGHSGDGGLGDIEVHRATTFTVEASGKGVNVSRDLHAGGVATTAVLPIGGATGRHLSELLAADGVPTCAVPVCGDTRVNTSLLLAQQTLKVNAPGEPLGSTELDAVLLAVREALTAPSGRADGQRPAGTDAQRQAGSDAQPQAGGDDDETWVVVAGSLPPGLDSGAIGALVELAHELGARVAVDASGPALTTALDAGADLLAPNREELAELTGTESVRGTVTDLARAAATLARRHGVELLVSMGGDGAIHADGEHVTHGTGPVLVPVNTAGAGDAFLSGWLSRPGTAGERMARALAWGRSACLCPTTVDPHPGTRGVDGIEIIDLGPVDERLVAARPAEPNLREGD